MLGRRWFADEAPAMDSHLLLRLLRWVPVLLVPCLEEEPGYHHQGPAIPLPRLWYVITLQESIQINILSRFDYKIIIYQRYKVDIFRLANMIVSLL